ncbi:WhiB family transcriptional regulator [Streptomyces sp. NPDC006992]|uniref:WhiB family transcriptional regulator n=1 Tax=Streptomyces sp. NPDC006992 TaxID=3155601 RepID=UPI0033DE235F
MTMKSKRRVYPTEVIPADPAVPYPQLTDREPCRTSDEPDQWFHEDEDAGLLCQGCPVLAQCALWALANPQLSAYGVWGGMTSRQRASIYRRRARAQQKQQQVAA